MREWPERPLVIHKYLCKEDDGDGDGDRQRRGYNVVRSFPVGDKQVVEISAFQPVWCFLGLPERK